MLLSSSSSFFLVWFSAGYVTVVSLQRCIFLGVACKGLMRLQGLVVCQVFGVEVDGLRPRYVILLEFCRFFLDLACRLVLKLFI